MGVLCPASRQDVARIVRAAGRYGVKLHAVSCGRNWGFGSSLPPEDGVWLLDLSRLNRISSYQPDTGTIHLEPGVTQIALHRELDRQGGDWFFNVTGAGHSTSVLGNALERGIGYHGQRQHDLLELKVITGRGDLISTRLGAGPDGAAPLGLDLTQLFVQSSLGIVVSARLRLLPRTNGGGAVIARLRNPESSTQFFDAILALKRGGAIAGVPHIANQARIVTTMAPWLPEHKVGEFAEKASSWTAALPISGCRETTQVAFDLIRNRLSDFCEVETIFASRIQENDGKSASPMEQLQQLASGFPSNLALPGVEWTALGKSDIHCSDPELTDAGLIHITPSVASSTAEIQRVLRVVDETSQRLGLSSLPMTVNVVDQIFSVIVISVGFPKTEAAAFRRKARQLEAALRTAKVMPYRIGLGQESWLPEISRSAKDLYRQLRETFDPFDVLAASKYEASYRSVQPAVRPDFAERTA